MILGMKVTHVLVVGKIVDPATNDVHEVRIPMPFNKLNGNSFTVEADRQIQIDYLLTITTTGQIPHKLSVSPRLLEPGDRLDVTLEGLQFIPEQGDV